MDGTPHLSQARFPSWLQPGLIRALAQQVAQDLAQGLSEASIVERAQDAAQAYCPALPRPHIREAVKAAMWVAAPRAGAEGRD
ncbi:hypothetical protein [Falsiroseomonas tokyonensis]|uniref:Uncharacterized protein n=1 Tax=Falsiroseomonas tokyonensis TaxID=430521 RepID=A0ABV7BXD3_9PROT|nr:hypothetical protein [Falsiroseomonas tokyonensis]MBU8538845.1 hypothetical protein [Falsiroseomonas tokyonensis]